MKHTLTRSRRTAASPRTCLFQPRWLPAGIPHPGNAIPCFWVQVGQLVFRNFASSTSLNGISSIAGNPNRSGRGGRGWNISLAWKAFLESMLAGDRSQSGEYLSKVVIIFLFFRTQAFNASAILRRYPRWGFANFIVPLDNLGCRG